MSLPTRCYQERMDLVARCVNWRDSPRTSQSRSVMTKLRIMTLDATLPTMSVRGSNQVPRVWHRGLKRGRCVSEVRASAQSEAFRRDQHARPCSRDRCRCLSHHPTRRHRFRYCPVQRRLSALRRATISRPARVLLDV